MRAQQSSRFVHGHLETNCLDGFLQHANFVHDFLGARGNEKHLVRPYDVVQRRRSVRMVARGCPGDVGGDGWEPDAQPSCMPTTTRLRQRSVEADIPQHGTLRRPWPLPAPLGDGHGLTLHAEPLWDQAKANDATHHGYGKRDRPEGRPTTGTGGTMGRWVMTYLLEDLRRKRPA